MARSPTPATIQACVLGGFAVPNSAVPVLAYSTPTGWSALPLPLRDDSAQRLAQHLRLLRLERGGGRRERLSEASRGPDGLALHHRCDDERHGQRRGLDPALADERRGVLDGVIRGRHGPEEAGERQVEVLAHPQRLCCPRGSSCETFPCWLMKAVLHEYAKARSSEMSPSCAGYLL